MISSVTNDKLREYRGLSSDTKPTDCGNGSTFFEMDTKKVFMFDEANHLWREI